MTKLLLLTVVLFLALGLASIVMKRLANISARIADLHSDMKRNELKMDLELQKLQSQHAIEETKSQEKSIDSK